MQNAVHELQRSFDLMTRAGSLPFGITTLPICEVSLLLLAATGFLKLWSSRSALNSDVSNYFLESPLQV